MTGRYLTQRILAWAVLPVLAFGAAAVWKGRPDGLKLSSAAVAAEMTQAEFERRIRDYLLAHPEVVGEAIKRLQAKQDEQDAADAKVALKAHTAEVFHDPDSPVGGNSSGNATVVEFFDYNCPYCKMMAPLVTKAEATDPQLRIVYKEFPILGPGSVFAAKAALAAVKQGKYEAFHRALYQVRGHVDEAKVLEVAGTVGLDVGSLEVDMQDKGIDDELTKNQNLAETLHITGTPGFVVGDQVTTGATDFETFQSLIGKATKADQPTK